MSEILSNITVDSINQGFTVNENQLTLTPEAIQLNIFTGAAPIVGGTNSQVQFNDNGQIAGNANLTFDKSTGTLTSQKLTVNSTSNLGGIGNVKITGGTNSYFLQTDGTGNLTWAVYPGNISGNNAPQGANTQIQYNDGGNNFGGSAGFTFDKTSNLVNMPGDLIVAGNISGNIANANYASYAGIVVSSSQPNITSLGNLTDLRLANGTVRIGLGAGNSGQNLYSVAVGLNAGGTNQYAHSIAIGEAAGANAQKEYSIAIGYSAGSQLQGSNSIAIGSLAAIESQANNSIVINATGSNFYGNTSNALFIKPIRSNTQTNFLVYNSVSGEVTYTSTISIVDANITGNLSVTGTSNLVGNVTMNNNTTINQNLSVTGTLSIFEGIENVALIGTQTGTYNYNMLDGAIQYSTSNANSNLVLNFRGNSTVTANTMLANGKSITSTFLITNGATAYGISSIQIDGSNTNIAYAGNLTPTFQSNTTQSYTFTIIKTSTTPTYKVLGSVTRYG